MAIDQAKLDKWFSKDAMTTNDQDQIDLIRAAGKELAETIIANTHPCADQSDSIRKVREAVMTAIDSIRCGSV